LTLARDLLARINGAVVTGQWQALRQELTETHKKEVQEPELTINDLADFYLEQYCKVHNTRPDFKEEIILGRPDRNGPQGVNFAG
jgi:hypothetical protein